MIKKKKTVTKTINGRMYFHPGYYIKEYLETQKISIEDFAKQLKVTPNYINKIINGEKDISCNIANKLHKLLGTSINFWINLQNSYNRGIKNDKKEN